MKIFLEKIHLRKVIRLKGKCGYRVWESESSLHKHFSISEVGEQGEIWTNIAQTYQICQKISMLPLTVYCDHLNVLYEQVILPCAVCTVIQNIIHMKIQMRFVTYKKLIKAISYIPLREFQRWKQFTFSGMQFSPRYEGGDFPQIYSAEIFNKFSFHLLCTCWRK